MVSRATISCLVGVNNQFSGLDNEVVRQLWKHEMCTTLSTRILGNFNSGLPGFICVICIVFLMAFPFLLFFFYFIYFILFYFILFIFFFSF